MSKMIKNKVKRVLFGKRNEVSEKANHFITFIIRIVLIVAFFFSLFQFRWTLLAIITLNFLITFLPKLVEKRYQIDLPVEFEIIVVIFIYASLFLGEVQNYYIKFWWWDIILHTGGGIALGFVGFFILYVLYKGNKINTKPLLIAIFSFCFAVALGAVWEIFEFSMDSIIGLNMQKSGLRDTMWDLIVDSLGALIASSIGYLYLKKKELFIFDRIVKRFIRDNPKLFGKK